MYIGTAPDEVFCQLRLSKTKVVHSKNEIGGRSFGTVKVMPPIGSLLPRERAIAKDRLNRYLDGYLAYRHFRNQLWERPSAYRTFKELLEATWHGLAIQHFENDHGDGRNEFSLMVREGKFPAEISWHGHGLQAWMQTMWFLARVEKSSTVILDEPDVYLHADLQRKLIKVIEGLEFAQSIIATHSAEIIGDVPFDNVTVVQKKERISKPADNADQIQSALRGMGSLHSIQLAKVAQAGLIFLVEGDDKPFLTDIAYKMGGRYFDAVSKIAVQEIKGKGNWQEALGAAKALREASGNTIATVLLLDRDYMLDEQVDEYFVRAEKDGLILKIWQRKEIENYFIDPSVVARLVSRSTEGEITASEIKDLIEEVEQELLEDVVLSFSDVLQKRTKPRIEPKTAFKRAKALLEAKAAQGISISQVGSGKDVISALSRRCQAKYGVSFNALALCKEMRAGEVDLEVKDLIEKICVPSTLNPTSFVKTS